MQINVLFVDDEINVLNGFKRMLYPHRNNWNGFFALRGSEALKIMNSNPIDVCVTDLIMPQMDGKELLTRVKRDFPKTMRILLSDHTDEKLAIRTFNLAHQYFIKPCNFDSFKEKIESPIILSKLIQNEETLKKLNGEDAIPTLPEIYYKLEREINSSEVSIYRIVNIISKDIALTAKIFQLVNSAYFGIAAKITDLYQAINILGLNVIKSLILYIKVFSTLETRDELKEVIEAIWNHSILVSNISQKITYRFTNKRDLSEQAYIAGILHDIGKVILLNIAINNNKLLTLQNNCVIIDDAETKKIYGATHSEIGAYTLALWGFPRSIIDAVLLHHSTPTINDFSISTAVQISNKLANLEGIDQSLYDIFYTKESIIEFINSQEILEKENGRKDTIS